MVSPGPIGINFIPLDSNIFGKRREEGSTIPSLIKPSCIGKHILGFTNFAYSIDSESLSHAPVTGSANISTGLSGIVKESPGENNLDET